MKVFLLLLVSISSFGQVTFEKGYLINDNNQRIECLIKNLDWKNNPSTFQYKVDGSDVTKEGDITSIREFGIYGYAKYIRADVKIDRSKVILNELDYGRSPQWSQEKLFLKVIVEGKASLYYHVDKKSAYFFYSIDSSAINQLIHKEYLINRPTGEHSVGTNNDFRQQLMADLKCKTLNNNILLKINYTRKEIERFFTDFNTCNGVRPVTQEISTRRNRFNIKITPGLSYSSLHADDITFDKSINFRMGVDLEYVLPFNKNKWSFVVEPTYQAFNAKGPLNSKINYPSIEFPVGFRHYFFLKKGSKIFIDGFLIPLTHNLNNPQQIDLYYSSTGPPTSLDVKMGISFAMGLGFEMKKVSLEVRYYITNNLLSDYISYKSDYQRVAIIAGYRILRSYTK